MIIEMDPVWKKEGLDVIGTNYFTIGAINNGISTRYDPTSPYYQAWLGGYVVKFNQKRKWSISDHSKLAEADQKNWLILYGNKNPRIKVDYDNLKDLGEIVIGGFNGQLYEASIYSDSDVGKGKIKFYDKLQIAALAFYMNKNNPKLHLTYRNLVPVWTNKNILESYQYILLKGYCAVLDISESVKAVLYINVANYKDKNGKVHDNFKKQDKELLELIKNIGIKKI
jgi:hypothetical protein